MASATFPDYVNVVESAAMLIMYIYVTVSTTWILWRMFKRRKHVASNFTPTLILHIFMWFVASITGVVCNAYMVLAFHPEKAYPIMPYFWTNIPNFTAIFAAVTAGIFLVIDRIYIAFVTGTMMAGIIFYNIIGAKAGNDYCYNVGCAINPYGVSFTILYRYILEVIYTLLGVLCLWLLRRFNKRIGKIHQNEINIRKGEAIVKFTIYTNIFVEAIPLLIAYLFMDVLKLPIYYYMGAFTRVFAIINGTICAWKYTNSLKMMDTVYISSNKIENLTSKSGTVKSSEAVAT